MGHPEDSMAILSLGNRGEPRESVGTGRVSGLEARFGEETVDVERDSDRFAGLAGFRLLPPSPPPPPPPPPTRARVGGPRPPPAAELPSLRPAASAGPLPRAGDVR